MTGRTLPEQLEEKCSEESYYQKREKQSHLDESQLRKEAPFPSNALVELTNGCNHSCVFCKNSNQKRRIAHLDLETFTSFIKQATPLGLKEVGLYSTGEPFMTQNLEDYISIAKQNGISRVYLTTNGALASLDRVIRCYESGLDSIKFSINASNRKEYALVHGQDDFDKVLRNVEQIYEWKTAHNAKLQMLCSCVIIPALTNVEAAHRKIFNGFFEDIMYVRSGSQGGQAIDLIKQFGEDLSGVFTNLFDPVDSSDIKPCQMLWNRYHLTAEGYLTACCVDYELDLVFANLRDHGLDKAWNNDLVMRLRDAHLNKKLDGLICDQCLNNRPAPYLPISDVRKKLKTEKTQKSDADRLLKRIKITVN